MEPTAAAGLNTKALIGVVREVRLFLPHIQRPAGNLKGKFRLAQIKHGLPHKELVAHPHIAVPVAVVKIVGGCHIHRADAGSGPHFVRVLNMRQQTLPPRLRGSPGKQRIHTVHALVVVLPGVGGKNALIVFVIVIDGVGVIAALFIPAVPVQSVAHPLNVCVISGNVRLLAHGGSHHLHDLGGPNGVGSRQAGAHILLLILGDHGHLGGIIVHTAARIPVVVSGGQAVAELAAGGTGGLAADIVIIPLHLRIQSKQGRLVLRAVQQFQILHKLGRHQGAVEQKRKVRILRLGQISL